jgi:hypothetical protein
MPPARKTWPSWPFFLGQHPFAAAIGSLLGLPCVVASFQLATMRHDEILSPRGPA